MTTQRAERVQEALRREISKIIHGELKDPRVGMSTSVTCVDLTKDLRFAKIYYTVLGEEKERAEAQKGLDSAKGFIRKLIGDRLRLRFTPEIIFKHDESIAHARQIHDVLTKIEKERKDEERD